MKQILIILPSRSRNDKIEGFYEFWRKNNDGYSEVLTCLDEDDPMLNKYKRHKDINYNVGPGKSFSDVCNRAFSKYSNYKYYYIMSDDHRIKSKGWETVFSKKISDSGGKGVAYGNDLMFGEKLSTAAFVSGNIFRALGFVTLPELIHMFTDAFWMEIGKGLNKLFYFPDIIIEHLHYSVNKSSVDSIYLSVNNKIVYNHDRRVFNKWKKQKMLQDIKRIVDYTE